MRRTCIRFPLSVLLSIAVSGVFFYMIYTDSSLNQDVSDTLIRMIFTGITLFFLSIATVLFLETGKQSVLKTLMAYVIILIF